MTIHWFPGHMARAREEIAAAIQRVHVVIELVDARLPMSSRNPLLVELAQSKPVLTLFTKSDLADPSVTAAWLDAWVGPRPMALVVNDKTSVSRVPSRCRELAPQAAASAKGLRAMVVGIPNVGKSTLINTLAGRRVAKVGDRPAVTLRTQVVELGQGLSIHDTPGVLWPRLDDQEGALRLAASGAIGENAFELADVAVWAIGFIADHYRARLVARYKIDAEVDEILARDSAGPAASSRGVDLLEAVGRRRGALRAGGHVDLNRAADLFLRELRGGKMGAVSYERPPESDPPAGPG